MQATFINFRETTKNGYKGYEYTVKPEPYKGQEKPETTRFVLGNSPIVPMLQGMVAGDIVKIEFDDTRWKNPIAMTKLAKQEAPKEARINSNTTAPTQKTYGNNDPETQLRIARSVAIKEACNLVIALADKSYTAANLKKIDFMASECLRIASMFETYVNLKDPAKPSVHDAPLGEDDDVPFGVNEFGG